MGHKWNGVKRKCNSETLPLARPPATMEWMERKWDGMEMEMEQRMRQKWHDDDT